MSVDRLPLSRPSRWPAATSAFWPLLIAVLVPAAGFFLTRAGAGIDSAPYLFIAAIPLALASVVLLIGMPILSLYLLVLWVPVQYFLTIDVPILPSAADRFDEFLMVALTASWVILVFRDRRLPEWCPKVTAPAVLFLLVGTASMLLNRAPVVPALFGMALHLEYILAFWAVLNLRPSDRTMRRLIAVLLAYAFVQFPVMVWQWHGAGAQFAFLEEDAPDLLRGTMGPGGGNAVGYFVLFGIGILLGLYRTRASGAQAWKLAGVFVLLVPFVLSGSRIGLAVLAVFVVWLFLRRLLVRPGQLLLVAFLALFTALGVAYYVTRVLVDAEDILTLELNLRSESDAASVGRLAYYPISLEVLHKRSWNPLIGTGPATYFSLAGRKYEPPLAEANNFRWRGGLPPSGIMGTGVEYGYLGLAAMYWIIFSFFRIARSVWRRATDPFWEGVARGYSVALLLFAVSPLIANVWEFQGFAFVVWFLGAALYRKAGDFGPESGGGGRKREER